MKNRNEKFRKKEVKKVVRNNSKITQKKSDFLKHGPKPSLRNDTRGLSTVEYIILLVLIAAAGVATWNSFGTMINERLGEANTEIDTNVKMK
ncbi:MAG: hypothetical protein JXR91_00185 [Deltaproteobacteria bacterium]|nr:hypothetical protein [Deltaproteobacteria bacterium]